MAALVCIECGALFSYASGLHWHFRSEHGHGFQEAWDAVDESLGLEGVADMHAEEVHRRADEIAERKAGKAKPSNWSQAEDDPNFPG